ncbi:MAG: retropepsin-like domain-containing protein [Armatimonadota bacterium]|nr:retropepsin-like domain-containing protein [Armatimonadota bacterium]
MSESFNPQHGLIIVRVEVFGPLGIGALRLALDTGAMSTLINVGLLVAVGYDPALAPHRVQITTGSGVEYVPRLEVIRLKALGQERTQFPVLAHTLPPSAGIDGLLGLDFLRGQDLNISFRQGYITLS